MIWQWLRMCLRDMRREFDSTRNIYYTRAWSSSRDMTADERAAFDRAFQKFDEGFKELDKVFK